MSGRKESTCPGCGLVMPVDETAFYPGYYCTSPECWSVYTEVLGAEFGNALLFGQVHQLTVDTYAVQHAGGSHPDKSVDIHLVGMHLVKKLGHAPTRVPPLLQRLAGAVPLWPHFPPPSEMGSMTVFDAAMAGSVEEHIKTVKAYVSKRNHQMG